LTSRTEVTAWGGRFFRSGRLKRAETVGQRSSMPENVIAMLIQPQKSTKTRPKGGADPPLFNILAICSATHARIFSEAAARSTFQPASLCQITRNTLPRARTHSRPSPRRFFKPLLVDSIPDRIAYRSLKTSVSCSRRRAARRRFLSASRRRREVDREPAGSRRTFWPSATGPGSR